ncbi:putative baseplate assembly protein, partial [Streptomyces cavourensis]|nr:putative baseplate assembly protein [Streptomyces cavourensis]
PGHIALGGGGAEAGGAVEPFGRPVQYGEVFAVLQQVRGAGLVEEVRLFPADPITGRRGGAVDRIDVAAGALVFSHQHQVIVTASGPGEGV